MTVQIPIIPIYTSRGDAGAFFLYPYLYNLTGEWIGWVSPDREVFSVLGFYVGQLSEDTRILRKKAEGFDHPRINPPPQPQKITPPASVPLAPMLKELGYDNSDVLIDQPDLLHTTDTGERKEDMN
jgi:hypothetical protein